MEKDLQLKYALIGQEPEAILKTNQLQAKNGNKRKPPWIDNARYSFGKSSFICTTLIFVSLLHLEQHRGKLIRIVSGKTFTLDTALHIGHRSSIDCWIKFTLFITFKSIPAHSRLGHDHVQLEMVITDALGYLKKKYPGCTSDHAGRAASADK